MIHQPRKRWILALAIFLLSAAPLSAGVVYEIEVKDHEQSPPTTESIETAVEGRHLKIGMGTRDGREQGDMIFRGDSREMVIVDHEERSYMVMDRKTMEAVAGQVNSAMSQMEEALKNVPADKRAMVEQMMKQKMPAQAPSRESAKSARRDELRKTGESARKAGYPCVKYEVLRGGRVTRELWVTDWDNIEGGEESVEVYEDMADFFRELMDSMPKFGQDDSGMDDNFFVHMKELGGYPVVVREFDDDGSLESESTLRSARRQDLDPDAFEPPSGYKRQEMFGR